MDGHIGAKCRQPSVTFDALEKVQAAAVEGGDSGVGGVRSWAHVVKSGVPENELQRQEEKLRNLKEAELRKEKAAADKAKADAEKISAERAASEKADADKLLVEKAASDKAAADKIRDSKVAADKATDNKVAEEKAAALEVVNDGVGEKADAVLGSEELPAKAAVGTTAGSLSQFEDTSGKHKEKRFKLQGISQIVNVGSLESSLEEASHDTSKAGCSPASDMNSSGEGSDLIEGQELKITAADKGVSSCESSPRYHKPAGSHQMLENGDLPPESISLIERDLISGLVPKNSEEEVQN